MFHVKHSGAVLALYPRAGTMRARIARRKSPSVLSACPRRTPARTTFRASRTRRLPPIVVRSAADSQS